MKAGRFWKEHRNDVILIGALLLAAGLLFLGFSCRKNPGTVVTVEVDGVEIARYPLAEDGIYPIETKYGQNILVIRGCEARIDSADCRDHICVRHAAVKNAGDTIVCLPHRLVVTVRRGSVK